MEEEFIDQPSMFDQLGAGGQQEHSVTPDMVKEAIDTKEVIGPMVLGPGWDFVKKAAQQQIDQRMAQLREPVQTTEELIRKESLINEVNGIELFLQIPQMLLDNANEILEAYEAQNEGKENPDG